MAVTLFPSGIDLNDTQEARLDAYMVAVWLPRYVTEHDGDYPPSWPTYAGHVELAEWAIHFAVVEQVKKFERREEEGAITIDPW